MMSLDYPKLKPWVGRSSDILEHLGTSEYLFQHVPTTQWRGSTNARSTQIIYRF